MQERLKAKREQNEAEEKKKAIELEKSRRKTGQEMLAAKQRQIISFIYFLSCSFVFKSILSFVELKNKKWKKLPRIAKGKNAKIK